MLPKKDLPKSPFFMFDLDKATNLTSSNFAPDNLLKAALFTEDKKSSKHPLQEQDLKKLRSLLLKPKRSPQEILDYLKTLSPSGIEIEILSLSSFDVDHLSKNEDADSKLVSPNKILQKMMEVFEECVEASIDCDFLQAVLNVFLKKHADLIVEDQELSHQMAMLKDKMDHKFSKLEHLINGNLCMTQYFAAVDNY